MTKQTVRIDECLEFISKFKATSQALCDVLADHNLNAEDGERILAFVAGLSAGARDEPLMGDGNSISEMLAFAWTVGASGMLEELNRS